MTKAPCTAERGNSGAFSPADDQEPAALLERAAELADQAARAPIGKHRALFRLYRDIDGLLDTLGRSALALRQRSAYVTVQAFILDSAAAIEAASLEDLTYKLALWRWDYHRCLDETWPRGDIVAASVLEDLVSITGEEDAQPPEYLPGEDQA